MPSLCPQFRPAHPAAPERGRSSTTLPEVITWRSGVVEAVGRSWGSAVELTVRADGVRLPALAYPPLAGTPAVGDRVLLNTGALDLGLGTGGYALVVALPDRLPPDAARPGHLIKARYTPMQTVVLGVDEPDSPWHDLLADADDLGGMPVVVADLHSAVPAILAGLRTGAPNSQAAYVMTDGGALPLGFSRTIAGLRETGWLVGTITAQQAFGGDLEAVTLHSGLLAARLVLQADVAVVTQGPGNLGTDTRFGFSGVAAGEAINAAAILGGRPVATLRISAADPRPRHRGISHHSLTAYGRVALAAAEVAVPDLPGMTEAAGSLSPPHRLVKIPLDGLAEAMLALPVPLHTMGRDYDDDPDYFLAAAAAGRHAATLLAHDGR
jgi:Protein of unknown function (DUF3866)